MSASETRSIIGVDLRIKGDLTSSGTVWIHGQFEGSLRANSVVIELGGHIDGAITADEIIVSGTLKGDVSTRSIEIRSSANVSADIVYEQMTVASGAALLGQVKRYAGAPSIARTDQTEAIPA